MNTELKYKTFDELLSEVSIDFTIYNNEGLIEPSQLIKVAQRVNYDLGLRIHGTKEVVLELEHGKAKLPDDFYVLNYAFVCSSHSVTAPIPSGRHTENVIIGSGATRECHKCYKPVNECGCEATYVQECQNGESIYVQVVEKRKTETRIYNISDRLTISTDTGKRDALGNIGHIGYIKNGFIYTNVGRDRDDSHNGYYSNTEHHHGYSHTHYANVFISYQGALEDEEGNLLVLDHPMINEYYEYAIKQRLLENLFINGEDVAQKLQIIEQRLRAARNNALTIVNTPDFAEMYTLWRTNRKAMYAKYYDMFKSYGSNYPYNW